MAALQDTEFAQLSDRDIAKLCGVEHHLVAKLREPSGKTTLPVENGGTPTPQDQTVQAENGASASDESVGQPFSDMAIEAKNGGDDDSESEVEEGSETLVEKPIRKPLKADRTEVEKTRTVPLGSLEDITRERDELRDQVVELGRICEELTAEAATLQVMIDSDDQIATALAEAKKDRELRVNLEQRLGGIQHEKECSYQGCKIVGKQSIEQLSRKTK